MTQRKKTISDIEGLSRATPNRDYADLVQRAMLEGLYKAVTIPGSDEKLLRHREILSALTTLQAYFIAISVKDPSPSSIENLANMVRRSIVKQASDLIEKRPEIRDKALRSTIPLGKTNLKSEGTQ